MTTFLFMIIEGDQHFATLSETEMATFSADQRNALEAGEPVDLSGVRYQDPAAAMAADFAAD